MTVLRLALALGAAATVLLEVQVRAQQPYGDSQAVTQFQRALDEYAFQHRQVERRVGGGADQPTMAAAMREARPSPADGAIFTPVVAAAFRARLAAALRTPGCTSPGTSSFVVPRPNDDAGQAIAISGCLVDALPRLPAELEYRAASVTLVLVDTHANLVVDVLHAAFPPPAAR